MSKRNCIKAAGQWRRVLLLTVILAVAAYQAARAAEHPNTVFCEYWRNIAGSAVSDLTGTPDYLDAPSESVYLNVLEIPENQGENFGTRLTGYVEAPLTGAYTFWIASDDSSELYLSTSGLPGAKALIASVNGWTEPRAWDAAPQQRSKPVQLTAGGKYYFEVLHKQGGGGSNLAVGWQLPDGTFERPIPGKRLSPAAPPPRTPPPPPSVKLLGEFPPTTPGQHKLKAAITFNSGRENSSTMEMAYIIYLPKSYVTGTERFPLFLFLHGNTHQGTDWNGLLNEGPPQDLNNNAGLRDWFPLIAFFPQCPPGLRWDDRKPILATAALLDELCRRLRVDQQRLYCSGLSMGGKGTWLLAMEIPERFAAIAPISAVDVQPDRAAEKLHGVHTWIIAGANDGGYTEGSRKMKAAFDKQQADVELTIVPNENHWVWARYYPDPKFYEHLLQHRRSPVTSATSLP